MAREATLFLKPDVLAEIRSHLLPAVDVHDESEEAAFGFARSVDDVNGISFHLIDWAAITPEGFTRRSRFYLELTDTMRAKVIKIAHDLDASLVEFHSHPFQTLAEFSSSDLLGLQEFVPHVWWRLKGKPYLAIVTAPSGFDGIAWIRDPHSPTKLREIFVGGEALRPTGLTFRHWSTRK
jgi:hypothetical protein